MESITDQIIRYKHTGEGLEFLIDRIALYIYFDCPCEKNLSEDERSDFFCYFFPKIPGLIDRFVFTGKPFESYLNTSIKWQARSFRISHSQREKRYRCMGKPLYWYAADDPEIADPSCDYEPRRLSLTPTFRRALKISGDNRIHDPSYQRRLLLLILKSAYQIEPERAEILSRMGGFDPVLILSLLECLRNRYCVRQGRLRELDTRRNLALNRIYQAEESLFLAIDQEERDRLARVISDSRKRLMEYIRELRNLSLAPSNREVAEILGIPKGTVDSALSIVKKRLNQHAEKQDRRSA